MDYLRKVKRFCMRAGSGNAVARAGCRENDSVKRKFQISYGESATVYNDAP